MQRAVKRCLEPGHHVRKRAVPQAIATKQCLPHGLGQICAFRIGEFMEPGACAPWSNADLVCVAGPFGDERNSVLADIQHAPAIADLALNQILEQRTLQSPEMVLLHGVHARRNRGNRRVAIDLAVRVVQRDTHLDAAVLEGQYVANEFFTGHCLGALCPDPEQQLQLGRWQCRQAGCSILREHHDLATSARCLCRDGQLRRIMSRGQE